MYFCPYISTPCPYLYATRVVYSITINTASRTLTLYKDNKWFKSYTVAIGKPSTPTPKENFKVKNLSNITLAS